MYLFKYNNNNMNNENDDDDDDLQAFQLIVLARYLLGVPQFWLSSMEDQKERDARAARQRSLQVD